MKKYLLIIITVLAIVLMPNVKAAANLPDKTDHEKVKVYLFRGQGCPHCQDFLNYFVNKYSKYTDYFEIVAYESWKNSDNQKLLLAVKKELKETEDASVPFIVIGNSYHKAGFSDSVGKEVIEEALKAYQDDDYEDLVASIAKKENITDKTETILEAAAAEDIIKLDEDGQIKSGISDGLIVGIIFAVVILGFGGLVFFSRK